MQYSVKCKSSKFIEEKCIRAYEPGFISKCFIVQTNFKKLIQGDFSLRLLTEDIYVRWLLKMVY